MELYSENKNYKLYHGNMLDMLDVIEKESISSIVTDPPYELNFMNKGWDNSGIAFKKDTWEKCYQVLKPGGYLLAFGGSRTYHRIACAIEDAGFEIRDTILWLYGCLSEDTEVLTKRGFMHYNKLTKEDEIRIYDIENRIYKWEKPQRWQHYSINKDTCYHIKSDTTDQIVSKNHRCLIEQDGKLVFKFAENLGSVERVPVLSYNIPYLQKSEGDILFTNMLWQSEGLAKELFRQWKRNKESKKGSLNGKESSMEGWSNISLSKRELLKAENKICEVSERIYNDGEKRWLCDGASISSSESTSETPIEKGSSTSHRPQCREQSNRKSNVICIEQRPQGLREWKTYNTTLASIEPIEYSGIIFCPTVSTGCFVARRNGKVFITGNSGFPKSLNIGLAIDKKNGVDSKVIGTAKSGSADTHTRTMSSVTKEGKSVFGGEYEIKQAQNEWAGWGSCLKPAFEPIIVARKPFEGSLTDNVIKNGVGGLNIDECRVPLEDNYEIKTTNRGTRLEDGVGDFGLNNTKNNMASADPKGRFPSNVILTYGDTDFDEVCGGFPIIKSTGGSGESSTKNTFKNIYGDGLRKGIKGTHLGGLGDEGSAARYFYCAKASKRDRDEGLEEFKEKKSGELQGGRKENSAGSIMYNGDGTTRVNPYAGAGAPKKNTHPTVKPTDLMQYLVRLVTPKDGIILDPFNGSGSTGKAVMYENKDRNKNYTYIGIELTDEYLPIAKARIEYACNSNVTNVNIPKSTKEVLNKKNRLF